MTNEELRIAGIANTFEYPFNWYSQNGQFCRSSKTTAFIMDSASFILLNRFFLISSG